MNLEDMKNTWQQQSNDTVAAIKINQSILTEMKVNKQVKELKSMKWARIIESVAFFYINPPSISNNSSKSFFFDLSFLLSALASFASASSRISLNYVAGVSARFGTWFAFLH